MIRFRTRIEPVKGGGHGIRWWESERLTAYKQYMVRWLEKELNTL